MGQNSDQVLHEIGRVPESVDSMFSKIDCVTFSSFSVNPILMAILVAMPIPIPMVMPMERRNSTLLKSEEGTGYDHPQANLCYPYFEACYILLASDRHFQEEEFDLKGQFELYCKHSWFVFGTTNPLHLA